MGYLQSADSLHKNTALLLDRILDSPSAITLQGLGVPLLVTWFNYNSKESNAVNGIETTDNLIGNRSGVKYNRVDNLPIYGVNKDVQSLEIAPDDNGIMDTRWEIEPIIPPNTIIPSPYDYMIYRFGNGRVVMFRATDTNVSTLKVNGYYKVPMTLVDVDSDNYPEQIEDQVIDRLKVKLERIGTNEKCIISTEKEELINRLENLLSRTMEDYVDTFFITKYNSFVFRGYNDTQCDIYDPYLTRFIITHNLLGFYPEILQPVIIDQADDTFRAEYNKSLFRAVELRDWKRIKQVLYDITEFKRGLTNPFKYWGVDTIYLLKLYQDKEIKYPKNRYIDFDWLYHLNTIKESNSISMMENIVIRYFQTSNFDDFLHIRDIEELEKIIQESNYTELYFYLVPIVVYIISLYKDTIN